MNTQHSTTPVLHGANIDRRALILALEGYRREWQETAGDRSLLDIVAPVGLVISDIVESLDLTSREGNTILGRQLFTAVSHFLDQPVQMKQ